MEEKSMTTLESRLESLERRVRSLETGIKQDLDLIASSAQIASPGRGAMRSPPPSRARCWTCNNALVVETWQPHKAGDPIGEGDGNYVGHSICRLYTGAVDGVWKIPGVSTGFGDVANCYSYQEVPPAGT